MMTQDYDLFFLLCIHFIQEDHKKTWKLHTMNLIKYDPFHDDCERDHENKDKDKIKITNKTSPEEIKVLELKLQDKDPRS